jgi:hypothetical protein
MRPDRSRFPAAQLLCASALGLAALGCAGGDSPVGRLEVSPAAVTLPHGQARPLTLSWTPAEALAGLEGEPLVFVHLLSEPGRPLRTFDHPFPRDWRPGTPVRYELPIHQSALAPPLPAGSYRLTVGLYAAGGRRWALEAPGEEIDGGEYAVATVEVPAESPGPRFGFAGPWLEVEPGDDLQMLARRWLLGDGALRLRDAPGAGTLAMTLRIPEGGRPGERLVLDPGAAEPGVVLAGTCSEVETGITGRGTHEVRLPVAAGAPPCAVRFDVNFHLVTEGSLHRRTVALEGLAWTPGPGT